MNPTWALFLIFVFVVGDFLWLDQDNKRWGWRELPTTYHPCRSLEVGASWVIAPFGSWRNGPSEPSCSKSYLSLGSG
ncbi:hypothetical protein [Shouchella tritolerans]|uniref:hypothetical protein n=1 Tax=Shouchella tritolerans TaxID=2979466 RepID=UPI0021E89BCA|nr:hypothetical protein [Shouchella tritolerans]